MLGCIFALIVGREQHLWWCFLLRFVFRKNKGKRASRWSLRCGIRARGSVLDPADTGAAILTKITEHGGSLLPQSVGYGFLTTHRE